MHFFPQIFFLKKTCFIRKKFRIFNICMPCRRNNHNDKTNTQTVCMYISPKKKFFALQTKKLVINNLNVTKINASTKVVTIYIFCIKKMKKNINQNFRMKQI